MSVGHAAGLGALLAGACLVGCCPCGCWGTRAPAIDARQPQAAQTGQAPTEPAGGPQHSSPHCLWPTLQPDHPHPVHSRIVQSHQQPPPTPSLARPAASAGTLLAPLAGHPTARSIPAWGARPTGGPSLRPHVRGGRRRRAAAQPPCVIPVPPQRGRGGELASLCQLPVSFNREAACGGAPPTACPHRPAQCSTALA